MIKGSPLKKKIYTVLTIILCLLLTFYIYEIVQINYIIRTIHQGHVPCYVWLIDYIGILFSIGAGIGGYYLSKIWWKIVYVEKRRWSDLVKKWKK